MCPHEIRLIFSLYINIYKYFSSLSLSLSLFLSFARVQQENVTMFGNMKKIAADLLQGHYIFVNSRDDIFVSK